MTKTELRQMIVDRASELGRVQNNVIIDKYTNVIWAKYSTQIEADDIEAIEKIRLDVFK